MKIDKHIKLSALLFAAITAQANAAPTMISALRPGAKVFEFYILDAKKLSGIGLSQQQELIKLTDQLAPFGITPCQIDTDVNGTGIVCGDTANGFIEFGTNELFTFNVGGDLPGTPLSNKVLDNGVNKRFGGNALIPVAGGLPTTAGRTVQIHFSQRVAQFGLTFAGATTTISGVQFIVNRQVLPVQTLNTAATTFVGVEDPHGFTDVTIVPSGGQSQTWIADHYSFLPLTQF